MHRRAFLHLCAIAAMVACAGSGPALAQTFDSRTASTVPGGTLSGGTLPGGTVGGPAAAPPPVAAPAGTAPAGAMPAATAAPGALPPGVAPTGTVGTGAMGAAPGATVPQPLATPGVAPAADPSLGRRLPAPRSPMGPIPHGAPQTGALAIPAAPPVPMPARPPLPPAPPSPPAQPALGLPPGAPQLFVTGGVYSRNAKHRLAIVNGQVVREGAEVAPGVVLEQITPRDVVLGFRGSRYRVLF